ncbi:MAG: UDP-4-amino-4,6-dideoxy-N-acetyl-beta-L-altrosamine transaminase [Betaproteobacteria bacterium]|nr:UDP-4-amino-4,6-dideoxy-N-acetyl-beta-L-altrosamine transaminase [Betaproteobacteria bacterium]
MIPYARQSISKADIDAVSEVLRSDWLTQGPAIGRFEIDVSDYCNARHAVALHSATAALHLSCLALGLQAGDWLWTSTNTFVASANCARYCGANVDFVDIDPETYNISVDALKEKLARAEKKGVLPKIVVPVHFSGHPCDMPAIADLALRYGFRVVEDASHAIGAEVLSGKVGNCRYSDVTVFSFHPVKILTTGEGGMVLTNDDAVAKRLRLLRTHGITRDPGEMTKESEDPWQYEQIELGFNYRMTDIQAALGSSQLVRLDEFISRRVHLARRYQLCLEGLPIKLPRESPEVKSSWHLYVINIDVSKANVSRRQVYDSMREHGVAVNVHYIPVHLQPYYRALGYGEGYCPVAEKYYQQALSLPLFFALTDSEQDLVVDALRKALHA